MLAQFSENEFAVRRFRPDVDLLRLVLLYTEIEAADQTGDDTTEVALRAQMKWRGHDPAQDRWVAYIPGEPDYFIGHAWVYVQTPERVAVLVAVHPAWRRKGVGSALLACTFDRARALGVRQVAAWTDVKNTSTDAFLRRHSFQPAGDWWTLHAPAALVIEVPHWPKGYTARKYAEVQDLAMLVKVLNHCYADMWGHAENTPGAVDEQRAALALAYWEPQDTLLVFAPDDDVVGICQTRPSSKRDDQGGERTHLLGAPGIAPAHRNRGLHRPMVLAAMHWLRSYAQTPIVLESYGDNEQTIAIYRDIGYVLDQHIVAYRRNVKMVR
jgi:mycothiol synthase